MTIGFHAPVACFAVAVAGVCTAPAVLAQVAFQLDLPRQELSRSLRAVARQTGINVIFEPTVVEGITAAGIRATLTVDDAIRTLLEGTNLAFERTSSDTIVIRKGAAATAAQKAEVLETVNVFASLDNQLSIGSKSGLSLRETPKSVTIVTRERIEAQNLTSARDALIQTTGVAVVAYSTVQNFFFSRGFQVQTVQLDGGAPTLDNILGVFGTPDTAIYDHIEMLRGVDGMYSGAGEPGGVINYVRKRATATPEIQASLSFGSWNQYRGVFDASGPLTDDGRLRGRLVGAYQDNDYFYDRGHSEKSIFFGTAEYDLTDSTLLIAGASYEDRKEDAYFHRGLPRYSDGRDLGLARDTSFAPDWSHWYFTTLDTFVRAEQKYGESGVIKLNLTRQQQDSEQRIMVNYGAVDPITLAGAQALGAGNDYESVQTLADLSANGTFTLFGREHRYTVGADYSKIDGGGLKQYDLVGYEFGGGPAIDVFNFDPSAYPEPQLRQLAYYPENGQTQHGFYATLGLQVAEPLRLTMGGRYGDFRYLSIYQPTSGTPTTTRYHDKKFIPSVALTWDFSRDWSAYVSYAETFKVQAQLLRGPTPGTPLDPITGSGIEFGVKGEILDSLNTSFAVYRVERNGQGVRDLTYGTPPTSIVNGSTCCYIARANILSEGFDAEVSGSVLPGWQMYAGYTFNSNSYGGGNPAGTLYLNMTPKHMLKLWTTWNLPGRYSRWTLNAGVLAHTPSYISGNALAAPGSSVRVPFRFQQDSYSVWNASVQYKLGDVWTVGLYADNLFDEKYYQLLGSSLQDNGYGAPRSVVLTVRAHW